MAFGRAAEDSKTLMGPNWSPMVAASLAFHLVALFLIIFLANSGPSIRPFKGTVYEVNLVEMPAGVPQKPPGPSVSAEAKTETAAAVKETKTPRIEESRPAEKPLVISKKTIEKTTPPQEKPKVSPSDLINKAISKIEKKVKTENVDHLNAAISKLQTKARSQDSSAEAGGGSERGQGISGGPMALYQMEVEAWIKSNWSYPVAMDKKQLEAVVVLLVRQDGTITKTRLEKRSADALFDESVLKAIERSNPLPPFPDSYRKSYDEFEITFNLKDLEGR